MMRWRRHRARRRRGWRRIAGTKQPAEEARPEVAPALPPKTLLLVMRLLGRLLMLRRRRFDAVASALSRRRWRWRGKQYARAQYGCRGNDHEFCCFVVHFPVSFFVLYLRTMRIYSFRKIQGQKLTKRKSLHSNCANLKTDRFSA